MFGFTTMFHSMASRFLTWLLATGTSNTHTLDNALAALASVSAVLWAGCLITWQLKAWSPERTASLDFLSIAFLVALLALFLEPLGFRIAMIILVAASVQYAWARRRGLRTPQEIKAAAKPRFQSLTDDAWERIAENNKRYYRAVLRLPIYFAALFIWPYQLATCFVSVVALAVGVSAVTTALNTTEDKLSPQLTTMNSLLVSISKQLQELISRLK
jgi:integrase